MLNKNLVFIIVGIMVAILGGYYFGDMGGYKRAQADFKKLEEASALKSAQVAAKAANPFQAVNPLEGVDTNPFQKVKKVLNHFN